MHTVRYTQDTLPDGINPADVKRLRKQHADSRLFKVDRAVYTLLLTDYREVHARHLVDLAIYYIGVYRAAPRYDKPQIVALGITSEYSGLDTSDNAGLPALMNIVINLLAE